MLRILLVERIRLTRDLLGITLQGEPDLTVVGTVASAKQTLEFLDTTECELVLIGTTHPNRNVLDLVRAIRQQAHAVLVVVVGLPEDPAEILPYVEAGASGFVLRTDSVAEMLQCIRSTAQNRALVSPEMASLLMEKVALLSRRLSEVTADPPDLQELTEREREVLDLVAAGRTNLEIAEALVIEVGTVKNHVHSILTKLKVHSRRDAGAYAPRHLRPPHD